MIRSQFFKNSIYLVPFFALLSACSESNELDVTPTEVVDVIPVAETVPVADAADVVGDPAIWVNPDDGVKSLVVGTGSRQGLAVYNLNGEIVYQNTDGRMSNVDVRAGYPITTDNGDPATAVSTIVVAATNRTSKEISVYAMNPVTGALTGVMAEPIPSNFEHPHGLCLYRSAVNGKLYVFATDTDGAVSQWQLYDNGLGQLRGTIQRTWPVSIQTEGCVADDANGWVFIGDEATGIWRYGAEPKDSFNERVRVDRTGLGASERGRLSAGVDGLSLYIPQGADNSAGYLVASSQGNFTYVIYDRAPPHAYRGTFQVVDNTAKGVDGSQETEGLDVVSANLGADYPTGLLVTQDGFNTTPDGSDENQNFKYTSWADIAKALELE